MSTTDAQKAKDKGNAAFKAENYPEAIGHYTAAILADTTEPTYPLNRAAAYLKLGKAVDAERDCSMVLRLSPGHVKALYRRAQARAELGKLNEAKSDLSEALKKEANNIAVKSELQKVEKRLSENRKGKPTLIDVGTPIEQVSPCRRRVPIEVVEDAGSPVQAIQPTDTLTPISSRLLHSKAEQALPTPSPSPARESPPASKQVPSPPATQAPTGVPPTVRGGIFRQSGEHTLFRSPETSFPTSQPASSRSEPVSTNADETARPPPMSLFDFSRSWELASPSERWDLLCKIPPQSLPLLFRASLEASLLVQVLEVSSLAVKSSDDPVIKEHVHDYLRWLQRVPRFSTVALFLSKREKELSRALAKAVGSTEWKV